MLVVLALAIMVLAGLVFALLLQDNPTLSTVLAAITAVGIPVLMYVQRRGKLTEEYANIKRLTLSPAGLRRVDATTQVEIPWTGIKGLVVTNDMVLGGVKVPVGLPVAVLARAATSAAAKSKSMAICGSGVINPTPGASKRTLKVLDRQAGSQLSDGQTRNTDNGIIFPAEFEQGWKTGTIGAWLRHYRPDLPLD